MTNHWTTRGPGDWQGKAFPFTPEKPVSVPPRNVEVVAAELRRWFALKGAVTFSEAADLLEAQERQIARYKRLETILRDESDVNYEGDGPNAAMSFLTQWEGPV